MSVLDRTRRAFRSGGTRAVWFGALGATVYRRLLVLDRTLDGRALASPDAGVRVDLLGAGDAGAYRELRPDQSHLDFSSRIASGELCFAAFAGARVVGATWARRGGGRCDYLDRELELPDDDVYLSDTYVAPAWRGRGIAPAIAAAQIAYFEERGARRAIAAVLPENRASLRSRAKSGFTVVGAIGWVGVGDLRWQFERGLVVRGA